MILNQILQLFVVVSFHVLTFVLVSHSAQLRLSSTDCDSRRAIPVNSCSEENRSLLDKECSIQKRKQHLMRQLSLKTVLKFDRQLTINGGVSDKHLHFC